MKSLSRLLARDRIFPLKGATKEEVLKEMVEGLAPTSEFPSIKDVYDAILEREALLSTGFGFGLAIPHAKLPGMRSFVVGLGIHRQGISYESLDDKPVHVLTMIVGPNSKQDEYLRVLSRVTSFLKDKREVILGIDDIDRIYELTLEY
jgi:PTS system nitrogen regulatory IIA component